MQRRSFLQGIFASIPLIGVAQASIPEEVIREKTVQSLWDRCNITPDMVYAYLMGELKAKIPYEAVASDEERILHMNSSFPFRDKYLRDGRLDIIDVGGKKFAQQIITNIENLSKAVQYPLAFHNFQVRFIHEDEFSVIEAAVALHQYNSFDALKQHAINKGFEPIELYYLPENNTVRLVVDNNYHKLWLSPNYKSYESVIEAINSHIETDLQLADSDNRKRMLFISKDKKRFGLISMPMPTNYIAWC